MNPNELIDAIRNVTDPAFASALTPPERPVEYIDDEDSTVRTGWQIQNKSTADWALSRVAMAKAHIADIESQRDEHIRRTNERADKLIEAERRTVGFMEAHLGKWATENRDALLQGSTKKSLSFVHGSIGWRRREGRLVVVDEAALKAWLTQQDDVTLFRVKVEPEMAALQQNYKAKGVIPPGMEFVATQEKLYIEPINLSSSMTRGNK